MRAIIHADLNYRSYTAFRSENDDEKQLFLQILSTEF